MPSQNLLALHTRNVHKFIQLGQFARKTYSKKTSRYLDLFKQPIQGSCTIAIPGTLELFRGRPTAPTVWETARLPTDEMPCDIDIDGGLALALGLPLAPFFISISVRKPNNVNEKPSKASVLDGDMNFLKNLIKYMGQ